MGDGRGFFAERRHRKALARAAREYATARAAHEVESARWQSDHEAVERMLQVVRDCREGRIREQFTDTDDYGFMLKPDEFAVAFVQGAAYIETVRAPSRYSGGYGGVSFPIFGSVRVNTGRGGGHITRGEETISNTDTGNAMVTNTRIMFAGVKRSKEWRFDKMLSCSHLPGGITIFAMSTGKPSGLGYGEGPATEVQFRIELASALALGTLDRYERELIAEQNEVAARRPVPPAHPVDTPVN
jgi:hypothetical protein